MKRERVKTICIKYPVSILCILLILLPIGILINGSLKGGGIQNYIDILTKYNIESYFLNSLIISVLTVTIVVIMDVMAGFAFSKINFRGKSILYMIVLSALLLPSAAILVPIFQINTKLGILNEYAAVIGPYIILFAPFNLLTIKNGFDDLPDTVIEAAMIDGCSVWRAMWKIAVPMCKPAVVMAIIWTFISSWNEYLIAFVMLRKESMMTITVIPNKFQQMYGGDTGKLYASLFIILVPVIIIYFCLQKTIVNGLNAGAVKE